MTVELRNVASQSEPLGYSHISIAPAGSVIHLAGQGGADPDGNVVGDLRTQTERTLLNLADALDAAGASPADLAKLTVYVVGWKESMLDELIAGVAAAGAVRPFPLVPVTLVGVQSLFLESMLVEVEAVAVVSADAAGRPA